MVKQDLMGYDDVHGGDKVALESAWRSLLESDFAGTSFDGYIAARKEWDDEPLRIIDMDDGGSPDDDVDNGSSRLRLYDLDGNAGRVALVIESGDNNAAYLCPPGQTLRDFVADRWYFGDVDKATGMAEFGFAPDLEDAQEGDEDVAIWVTRHYYAGTLGCPQDDYVRDDDYDIRRWDAYEQAQEWIDEREAETYLLAHGEYDAPEYRIVRV